MHERAPAVELRQIAKRFDQRIVLDDVSLAIPPGEFFAILGCSGSGKSTLLKMVSGIETPDTGQVLLGNVDVTAAPPYRRPVHTVFQNYALFPHLDVAGNVAFPLRMAGVPRRERDALVTRALQWVQMDPLAKRRVDLLSGGERQRVALARALVDEPKCVLLDEPLSALDPHLRTQTLELLRDIQARTGATYLYVTHDREEAMRAAHRIGILRDGKLAQVGSPRELYQHPTDPYVAGFIGKINWLRRDNALVGVRPEDVRFASAGLEAKVIDCHFAGACVSYRLQLGDDTTLAAEVRVAPSLPQLGERTHVTWDESAAHRFPNREAP